MTIDPQRNALIEAVTTAHRERVAGEIIDSSAWHDLDDSERVEAYERAVTQRRIEAAVSPSGQTSTVRAVLARLGG
ncbi:MAG: hypothetical protein KJO07_24495 [Deltaproteobacteria bacterium]|jgi:hypothetical protein|nr:hypothetical protein [Deltaproteobacteria bacterium]